MGRDRYEEHGNAFDGLREGHVMPGVGRTAAEWIADNHVSMLCWDFLDSNHPSQPFVCVHRLIWAIGLLLVDNCELGVRRRGPRPTTRRQSVGWWLRRWPSPVAPVVRYARCGSSDMATASLQDRVAIVTGAASGLGLATARRMVSEGAKVAIADIDRGRAATAAGELGDAGDRGRGRCQRRAVGARHWSRWSSIDSDRIDIVHNNAAALGLDVLGRDGDVVDMDVDVWDRTMAVNLRGAMLVCKHAIPVMRAGGGGAIVNTSSLSGLLGEENHIAYACSKAALLAFTRHVANMHGAAGIRCNAVAPGLMLTDVALERLSERHLKAFRSERLLDNAARPEDVANLVVFLASDLASCITGQTYVVDAGTMAKRPRAAMRMWEDMLRTGEVSFDES